MKNLNKFVIKAENDKGDVSTLVVRTRISRAALRRAVWADDSNVLADVVIRRRDNAPGWRNIFNRGRKPGHGAKSTNLWGYWACRYLTRVPKGPNQKAFLEAAAAFERGDTLAYGIFDA